MNLRPIKSDEDHDWAMARIADLMDAEAGSTEEIELEILAIMVDAYESARYPNENLDPIEAIKFRMDQMQLERKDLEDVFGTRARVSEILNGKRPLSLDMIRKLHHKLGIPLESLIGTNKDKTTSSPASSSQEHRAS